MPNMPGSLSSGAPVPTEFLSADQCEALMHRLAQYAQGHELVACGIISSMRNATNWARSAVHESTQVRVTQLGVWRSDPEVDSRYCEFVTDRLDDAGLREVMAEAALPIRLGVRIPSSPKDETVVPVPPIVHPVIWDDRTYAFSAKDAATLVQQMIGPAAAAGTMSAGEFRTTANGRSTITLDHQTDTVVLSRYYPYTEVECSVTVRDPKTRASGWAGVNHYGLHKIDPQAIAARALDKCRRSANPSAVEPGHYTAILEPQAVADLMWPLVSTYAMERWYAEDGHGPFQGAQRGRSKIGQRVFDPRLTLSVDPMDPDGGFVPFDDGGAPYRAVTWIDRGILRQLAYDRGYALARLNRDVGLPNPVSYRLVASPGVATLTAEEMIANTARGVLVTRFFKVTEIDRDSLICDGYTRDGLWLIEKGKISKPIKNFRFLESPVIAFNKLASVGITERVFQPGYACLAPTLCVNDFNFVGLADAV